MKVVMIGPFGLKAKSTMRERALPMARALVKREHQVAVIIPPWDSPEDAGKSWLDGGVQVINTRLPRIKGPLFHLQLTVSIVRLALRFEPDVVHCFKPKAYAGLAHLFLGALRKLARHNFRLVLDEDDWELAWNEKNVYTPTQKRFFAWQESWGLTHADAVTVASKCLKEVVENLKVPPRRIHYLPNGTRHLHGNLDVLKARLHWQAELAKVTVGIAPKTRLGDPPREAFFDRQRGQAELGYRIRAQYELFGYPLILLYTRFTEFQISSLMDVIRIVNVLLPETRWLIVGKGYFGEEEVLRLQIQKDGLVHKLILVGWVPMADVPYYFAAADVALHLYDDTPINQTKCSVKLLDLLSAGVPVVATNVGQNSEYIHHRKTGLLVPPGHPNSTAEALVEILGNYHLQRILGQAASQDVRNRFNWFELVKVAERAYSAGIP